MSVPPDRVPQLPQTRSQPPFNIIRTAAVELQVPDLGHARYFYVDLLGLIVTEGSSDALYLRAIEERVHHSLVLRRAPRAAVDHVAYRVAEPTHLDRLAEVHQEAGLPLRWLEPGERVGRSRCLRTVDPCGLVVEYFAEMAPVDWYLQRYHLHRGPGLLRIDHVNNMVPEVQRSYDWWSQVLGFRCSEYTDTDAPDYRLYAAWLHRKPNVHDIALTTGPVRGSTTWPTGCPMSTPSSGPAISWPPPATATPSSGGPAGTASPTPSLSTCGTPPATGSNSTPATT